MSNAAPTLADPLMTLSLATLLDRHGFAGQGGLVEDRHAVHDGAVDRDHVALPDEQPVARFDRVELDLFQPAVAVAHGRARHAGKQRGHVAAGAPLGKTLQILPARIHQRDDDGREMFAEDQRRQHRKRRDDIEADIAPPQADDDLVKENQQDRYRGGGPDPGETSGPSPKARPQCRRPSPPQAVRQ